MRDDFDKNLVAFALEQVPDAARDIVAERFEGVALDVRALKVGMLDIPDPSLIVVSGFDHGAATTAPRIF